MRHAIGHSDHTLSPATIFGDVECNIDPRGSPDCMERLFERDSAPTTVSEFKPFISISPYKSQIFVIHNRSMECGCLLRFTAMSYFLALLIITVVSGRDIAISTARRSSSVLTPIVSYVPPTQSTDFTDLAHHLQDSTSYVQIHEKHEDCPRKRLKKSLEQRDTIRGAETEMIDTTLQSTLDVTSKEIELSPRDLDRRFIYDLRPIDWHAVGICMAFHMVTTALQISIAVGYILDALSRLSETVTSLWETLLQPIA